MSIWESQCVFLIYHIYLPPSGDDRDNDKEDEETNDCPRDSGCFIPSECSDSKDDVEGHPATPDGGK